MYDFSSHSPYLTREEAEDLHSLITVTPDHPKPEVLFRDASRLLASSGAFALAVKAMCEPIVGSGVTLLAGVDSRGFIFAAAMAWALGVGFIKIAKAGKVAPPADRVAYALEYGEAALELPRGLITPGVQVAVVDDLLATGGSAGAAADLIRLQGGRVVSFHFLVELAGLGGSAALARASASPAIVHALLTY